MFIILSYDVNQKRVSKVMKICRKYLSTVHESVFEGYITEAKLKRLKSELENQIHIDEDSICIYEMNSAKYARKEVIGMVESNTNII